MTFDELKQLLLSPTLFRLDTRLATRLVPLLHSVGMAAIFVWAINHLFWSFGSNFGNGLWGLIEIVVFGGLALIVLRIFAEAVLVFFRSHEPAVETASPIRPSASLLDEVNDAIHDLAEADEATVTIREPVHVPPSPPVPPNPLMVRPTSEIVATDLPIRGPTVRRTAKRTPKPKPEL